MSNLMRTILFNYRTMYLNMAEDLASSGLFPNVSMRDLCRFSSLCCSPLRGNVEDGYVSTVKAWRALLCAGTTCDRVLVALIKPLGLVTATWPARLIGSGAKISMINVSFLICWKAMLPSQREPWTAFLRRVSSSGKPTLTPEEKGLIRERLRVVLGPAPSISELRGRNGPGAVAGGESGTYKWFFHDLPAQVPLSFYRLNAIHMVEDPVYRPARFGTTRALQVPKDARGPRYISCEPLAWQHAQFAVKDCLERRFLRYYGKRVNPYDTSEHTAYLKDHVFCTIDLKDASDMISRRLVWQLFPEDWRKLLFSVRSSFVSADGSVAPLRTFAPMGSSLCFDTMQMIICVALDMLTPARLLGFHGVGDDWIVSSGSYYSTLLVLAKLGLVVNNLKCCGPQSSFRESCGEEWYWDETGRTDVRPIYIRGVIRSADACVSALRKAQELRARGFAALADAMDDACAAAGFPRPTKQRWNDDLQRLEVLTYAVCARKGLDEELDGFAGLYRWFCSQAQDHVLDTSSARTVVRTGWRDATLEDTIRPKFLQLGTARHVAPGKNIIGNLPEDVVRSLMHEKEVEVPPRG